LSSRLLSKNLNIKIYRTIILPVVFYGCETWSLTLREERKRRVFENRVLRRIFGPRRDEVTGEWRRWHNEELNDLYSTWCMLQAGPPSLHYYCAVVLHSCIVLPPVGHSSNHQYHCCQLTDNRAAFRIVIALLRFSFDSLVGKIHSHRPCTGTEALYRPYGP